MSRTFRRLVLAAACATNLAAGAVHAQTPPAPDGVLTLSTSASVEVVRDIVSITFSTAREGADAGAVQTQLKSALDAALAEARKSARPGQVDVSTGNFQIYPRYAPKTGTLNGWQGTAELVVEGRDIAGIGQLASRITTLSVARVNHRLSREAQQKVEGDVAAEAIARFRAKAGEYAKQFGYAGPVSVREVNVQTSDPGQPMPMMRLQQARGVSADAAEPLSLEPGRATVTANVSGSVQMR